MSQSAPEQCLKESIRLLLETGKNSHSEYELIRWLNEQGWKLSLDASDATVLFKTHFLVYHALYELQVEYWASEKRLLDITALKIGFIDETIGLAGEEGSPSQHLANSDEPAPSFENHKPLRDYYLDLSHIDEATEESVGDLLGEFWSRFVMSDDKTEALAILELPATTDVKTLKQRYRSLAMVHHPDRGGDAQTFGRINWAFGILQKALA